MCLRIWNIYHAKAREKRVILQGTNVNFLGDSITEGDGVTMETRFTALLSQRYDMLCHNYGICGTRIARQSRPSQYPHHDLDFCMRADDMESDADAVVVFGGTNDFGHGDAPFGDFSDRTVDTFCGALHVLYRKLLEKYPSSLIVICTPLHRSTERIPRWDGHILDDFVQMIRKTAEYYSLPVLDLYAISGMQPDVPVIKEKLMPDGLHPNEEGHKILAELIGTFLERAPERIRL